MVEATTAILGSHDARGQCANVECASTIINALALALSLDKFVIWLEWVGGEGLLVLPVHAHIQQYM